MHFVKVLHILVFTAVHKGDLSSVSVSGVSSIYTAHLTSLCGRCFGISLDIILTNYYFSGEAGDGLMSVNFWTTHEGYLMVS